MKTQLVPIAAAGDGGCHRIPRLGSILLGLGLRVYGSKWGQVRRRIPSSSEAVGTQAQIHGFKEFRVRSVGLRGGEKVPDDDDDAAAADVEAVVNAICDCTHFGKCTLG